MSDTRIERTSDATSSPAGGSSAGGGVPLRPPDVSAPAPRASAAPTGATATDEPLQRPRRRARIAVGSAVVVALVAGGLLVVRANAPAPATAPAASTAKTTTTAEVTTRDLIERTTVDGTLGYGEAAPLSGPQGTVTAAPEVGSVVERGQTVVEVNGVKVPLFYGTTPLWRPLSGAVVKGPDIKVLEENLHALGYADGLAMTVDETWDDATLVAVNRWQEAMGHEQTGTVQPGDAMVHDGAARVAKVGAEVGQPAQGAGGLVEVTGTTRSVQAKLPASQQSLVAEGDAVIVELPGGASTDGRITKVGSVAAAGEEGAGDGDTEATLTVDIALADAKAAGSLDQAPVSVKITSSAATGVLAVPVNALLALREGGYAVEVQRGTGTQLVGVELGAFADGWVQVTGEVHEGDTVVVPR